MAKKVSTNLPVGVQNICNRLLASGRPIEIGRTVLAAADDAANNNVDVAVWNLNDSFIVPSEEELMNTFMRQPMGEQRSDGSYENYAFCVAVPLENGGAKLLYLSTLKKSAVPYSDELVPGAPVRSNTQFANECRDCATFGDLFNLLASRAGQRVTVTRVETVQTARFKDGVPSGTRRTTVPFFDCQPVAAGTTAAPAAAPASRNSRS